MWTELLAVTLGGNTQLGQQRDLDVRDSHLAGLARLLSLTPFLHEEHLGLQREVRGEPQGDESASRKSNSGLREGSLVCAAEFSEVSACHDAEVCGLACLRM